jgi:hypothetical protein
MGWSSIPQVHTLASSAIHYNSSALEGHQLVRKDDDYSYIFNITTVTNKSYNLLYYAIGLFPTSLCYNWKNLFNGCTLRMTN